MYRTYIEKIQRNAIKIIFFLTVLISGIFTGIVYHVTEAAAQADMQSHLAEGVLRFHVLANSDSDEDQALKLKVRDAILGRKQRTRLALPGGYELILMRSRRWEEKQ